jgi:hypothetical protein|tara:strand:- start:1251 stop:1667 length:417 start_codon:yes stop_codon:yes gene_type:complete
MKEEKGKLGLGKIYEKYLILKRNSHTLQIACVFDETTQSQEFFIVSQEETDEDVNMIPIAKLYLDRDTEKTITPMFEESALAQVVFNEYEENDERFTIEDIDTKPLAFDETYSNMAEMFKIGLNAIPKIKDTLEGKDE